MLDSHLRLFEFMRGYAGLLMEDVPVDRLDEQPAPGANTPRWIMGHLAVCTDFAAQLLGGTPACPDAWRELYGNGSIPRANPDGQPDIDEIMAAYRAGHDRVTAAAADVEPARLEAPNAIERLRDVLPTQGDFLAHLLTTHEATHLGQLSAWRRSIGMPPAMRPAGS